MDSRGRTRRTRKRARDLQEVVDNNSELLDGLSMDGEGYVKLDQNLIKRLKPKENEPKETNPFEDFPEFTNVLKLGSSVTLDFIQECSDRFNEDPFAQKMADILGNLPLELIALKYSQLKADDWNYSITLPENPKVSNQESSGRCWEFAALNRLRYGVMRKFQLDSKFEFSQTYLYFYDKLERSALFLEYMWEMRHNDLFDPKMRMFMDINSDAHPLSDGGQYSYFVNLANKYGLVPKNIYGESYNSRSSDTMNTIIKTVLSHMTLEIFENKDKWDQEEFQLEKDTYMISIYDLLVRFMGEPPKPSDSFDWSYKDINGNCHTVKNLTPEKFYRIIASDSEDKITVIHDPRHPETYFIPSWLEFGLNVHGTYPVSMINLPMNVFKRIIYDSLKNEDPVWFTCDVSHGHDFDAKTWDTQRFNYDDILGIQTEFSKEDMLDLLTSRPEHAMVFNGVDAVEDDDGNVVEYKKWRIDNSWGSSDNVEEEKDYGYYRMTDDFFNKYVYHAVVDLKYFEPDEAKAILENANEGKSFTYRFTDAFGTVAQCNHCKGKK
uniref:Aminopeptidase n=1 Tax=Pithovirus LCPAC302 TaxID=2506593 RepID=A0A481Z709_9VIRU|nr:MAG: aminopeptidase [Pithovirus LCPAC302]